MRTIAKGAWAALVTAAWLAVPGLSRDASAASVHVASASFVPASDSYTYYNSGYYMYGTGAYNAALSIPPNATITRFEIRVADSDLTAAAVEAYLYKVRVNSGTQTLMAQVSSTEGVGTRAFATTNIAANPVGTGRVVYIQVLLGANDPNLTFVGAEVQYTVP
jgi:hypothetical protein